jgi:hypothetical protein
MREIKDPFKIRQDKVEGRTFNPLPKISPYRPHRRGHAPKSTGKGIFFNWKRSFRVYLRTITFYFEMLRLSGPVNTSCLRLIDSSLARSGRERTEKWKTVAGIVA